MNLVTFWAALVCLAAAPQTWAQVTPEKYILALAVNSTSGAFSGTVDIIGRATTSNVGSIQLRSSGLNISTVSIVQTTQAVDSITVNNTAETLSITLDSSLLTTVSFVLSISFSGVASSDQSGLYSFSDSSEKFFVTNLYPSYARRLFPCFDDVGSRAAFQLTLSTTLAGVISNTAVSSQSTNGSTTTYVFNPTPFIPPSSLFFIIGPLTSYYTKSNQTLWLSPSFKTAQLTTDIYSALACPLYTSFHQLDGMPKLDIIVIPHLKTRSYSGYGVVVYRTEVLQIDYQKSTSAMQRESLLTILKGLFKIFYGTLTSPASWSHNYISDSVATYLSYDALSNISSSSVNTSNGLAYFFTDISDKALDLCTASTTVLNQTALSSVSDIETFVTGASMIKGAAILQMVSSIVPNTSTALLSCFSQTKNGSTGINSLTFLNCLNTIWASTSNNLTTIITPWLSSGGCPLIATERRDNAVYIVQKQIAQTSTVSSPSAVKAVSAVSAVTVPVTAQSNATGFNNDSVVYSSSTFNSPTQLTSTIGSSNWVVIDTDGQGYYRTQYDSVSWSLLSEALTSDISAISTSSRAKILSDSFWVAQEVDNTLYETLPDSIQFMSNDLSLAPWKTTIEQFRRLWNWIYHTGTSNKSSWEQNISLNFTNYATGLMVNAYGSLGISTVNTDSSDTKNLRREIVSAMCDFGYPICLSSVQQQFQSWLQSSSELTSDMLSVVVCNGLKSSTYDVVSSWSSIYNTLNATQYVEEDIRRELYKALACVSSTTTPGNSSSIAEFLSKILTTQNVLLSDVAIAFKAIYQRPEHTTQALSFFLQNQPSNLRTDLNETTQVSMMNDLAQYLSLDVQAQQLEWYVANNTNASTSFLSAVNAAQTTLTSKMSWIQDVQSYVHAGLDSTYTPSDASTTSAPDTTVVSTASPTDSSTAKPVSGSASFSPSLAVLLVGIFVYIFKF